MNIRKSRTLRKVVDYLQSKLEEGTVRQANTAGLRAQLNSTQRQALFQLTESAGYQVFLDIMEMACVEQDTRLVNSDPAHPETVLAEHRMSKAFWQIFVAVQKKIEYERVEFLGIRKGAEQHQSAPTEEELDTGLGF